MSHARLSQYIAGEESPRQSVERIARAFVPEHLEGAEAEEEYRRLANAGLRSAGFLPEDAPELEREPFLDQIREAGVIEDLPPETQREIWNFWRWKVQQNQMKRDGELVQEQKQAYPVKKPTRRPKK